MIGIVWIDLGATSQGVSIEIKISLVLDLLPLIRLCFELGDYLMKIVKSVDTSYSMAGF